ncbi:hypothetical protein [Chryseobacterium chendengshani]|uniref:hypothetical protein n=1 Tax=Chryseobacterium sp. LJ756 TaxID=2864113 RepID=UPI001C63B81F|nr:hypothetical protein [Chryseobacterium sp. LJ756]MBW7675174.1 hypothetical protein [Chryseobacterium sp. LJ756]
MIHTRVLELLKNPKNIQSEDLHLLKEEISSFPYVQNIRALHLYGVHLYDKENYQKALSATAAYTTDKKILYQLINGKIHQMSPEIVGEKQENVFENPVEAPLENNKTSLENENKQEEISTKRDAISFSNHDYEAASEGLIAQKPEIKHLVVRGERNRILFDGEENFLDEVNNETIDLESTLESGVIVTHKPVTNQDNLTKTDDELAIVAEELAGTSSGAEVKTPIKTEIQAEEITDNAELNLEEILPESDLNLAEKIAEAPKSELIVNENKIESEDVSKKLSNKNDLSFQSIQSLETHIKTEISGEETHQSQPNQTEETTEILNPELIVEEEKLESEKVAGKINDNAELSFHGTDSFFPEVTIRSNKSQETAQPKSEAPKSNINKHEDEMRRLIEEVEKRMKAKKESVPEKKEIVDEETGHDISFAETQAFHVGEEQKAAEEVVVKEAELIVEEKLEEEKSEEISKVKDEVLELESNTEPVSAWKPMSFETSRPDSLLNNPIEAFQPKEIQKSEESLTSETVIEEKTTEILEETHSETVGSGIPDESKNTGTAEAPEKKDGEAPVMNVSFFGSDIASLGLSYKSDQKEKAEAKEEEKKADQQKIDNSNVPGFINTWQSWLKIDRAQEAPIDKTEIKNKVIESFIENNPKISQLKDEVNFVVKEKTDDISHLMTETLANLYIEQKLYSKAVNAFLVLASKFPDRKEYFEAKIQEIKDNRGKS